MTEDKEEKPGKKKLTATEKRAKYYPQLKSLIEEIGEWNINFLQLGNEWDVPKSTMSRWKEKITKELGPIKVEELGREIQKGFLSNLKNIQRIKARASTPQIKLAAIKTYSDTVQKFTDFLEAYKYKEKIAEKLEHFGGSVVLNISDPLNEYPVIKPVKDENTDKEDVEDSQ